MRATQDSAPHHLGQMQALERKNDSAWTGTGQNVRCGAGPVVQSGLTHIASRQQPLRISRGRLVFWDIDVAALLIHYQVIWLIWPEKCIINKALKFSLSIIQVVFICLRIFLWKAELLFLKLT